MKLSVVIPAHNEAEVIEPAGVRSEILTRAKRLKKELGRHATGRRKVKAVPEPASD